MKKIKLKGNSNQQKEVSTIFRSKEHENFVLIEKNFLNDNRLSFKAKGIWSYLLSQSNKEIYSVDLEELINSSADNEISVDEGLKELKQYGYL